MPSKTKKPCIECGREFILHRGLCPMHYRRVLLFGDVNANKRASDIPTGSPCLAPGCERPARGRGLCTMHYGRWEAHGDIDKVAVGGKTRLVMDHPPSEDCILWTGKLTKRGYGPFRRIYEKVHGALPKKVQLDHRCRVRACVNVAHLEPVTASKNAERREDAYRIISARGDQPAEFWLARYPAGVAG